LWRVSRYASLLARQIGLSDRDAANVAVGGFLHDLRKIAVPDSVLLKTERLTDAEYAVIKTHPEVGKRLLAKHTFGERIADAVYAPSRTTRWQRLSVRHRWQPDYAHGCNYRHLRRL
jgi:HD-GYP domain-containing protein (c-di-GMP phosphodiesterase class II)